MNGLSVAQKQMRFRNELKRVKKEANCQIPKDLFEQYFDQLEIQHWICPICQTRFNTEHRPTMLFDVYDVLLSPIDCGKIMK